MVKKLLAKLKESERTVMTLHYFGDMTCEEISRFLGVSTSAIKLRLHRARQRLQKEEPMIREALSNFQLSPNLTENIMQEIPRIKPAAPIREQTISTVGIRRINCSFDCADVRNGKSILSPFPATL